MGAAAIMTDAATMLLRSLAVAFLIGTTGMAHADKHGSLPADMPASYRAECAGCHVAFPPDLLPADTWRHIMDGLADHFGVDSRIETPAREEIANFLVRNAGRHRFVRRAEPLRLTATLWFHRTHGRVKAQFGDPLVGSKTNCGACHADAEDGRYDEYTLLSRQYARKN